MCKPARGARSPDTTSRLGRPDSATKVRRRKPALMVESELGASDMTYGYRRVTAALHRKGVTVSADTVRPRHAREGAESRATAPEGPHHRPRRRHRHPPRPRGPGLPPPGPPDSNGSGTSRTSARGSGSCTRPASSTAATREGHRLRHGRQHENRPRLRAPPGMAVRRCPHQKNVTIFHSDRGSQYTSQQFARHLEHHRIRPSVGRTGVCWDNAWAESFNATLKNERVHRMVRPTREKAINFCCLVDRTDLQSHATPLNARLPHPQRGRTRAEKPQTRSLRPPKTTVRETPSTPLDRPSR